MEIIEDTLKKLNGKQLSYCKVANGVISEAIEKENVLLQTEEAGRLRGYLDCMGDMGILTEVEVKQLYVYFFLNTD